MWYAVETIFMNGTQLKSVPMFNPNANEKSERILPGTCLCGHDEEPHNTCQKFLNGIVEIHTDWFQTKEQAMQFINGGITYIVHYRAVYRKDIKSTIRTFLKWEPVPALGENLPYRGIYKDHPEGEVVKPHVETKVEKVVRQDLQDSDIQDGKPVKITVNEILNYICTEYKDKLVQVHHIKESTMENAFKRVYALRRSGRYDSYRRYEFDDPSLEKEFQLWREKNEDLAMYYGSATVD